MNISELRKSIIHHMNKTGKKPEEIQLTEADMRQLLEEVRDFCIYPTGQQEAGYFKVMGVNIIKLDPSVPKE